MPQPTKKRRVNLNISGLRNQKASNLSVPHLKHSESESEGQETPHAFGIYFNSTHVDWSNREGNKDEESDDAEDLKAEEYGDEKLMLQLAALTEKYNPTDQDWVPAKYRRERQLKKGRPASYAKGPGIANIFVKIGF
ncbi:hypothetical protein JB92DRAFT_3136568 [Gautieria morchelliformis]|nr:hypothetical protein JB92DRAFT_3136568 [Gautieria morchelliformis]